jgi:murein DD-endopeptidase MepM/ murein hydrolase activator NlpD
MRTRLILSALLLSTAVLCGCDDKTNTTTPPATTPPATTPPASTPPATTPPATTPPASSPPGGTFTYDPPGQLKHDSHGNSTGDGVADTTIWNPAFRFPMRCAPAYLNSQVYNAGGQEPGGFCDDSNYKYPWQDDFCEKRSNPDQVSWVCPKKTAIHQGQDIRAHTMCANKGSSPGTGTFWRDPDSGVYRTKYQIVAVEDATVSYIGSFSVYLTVMKDGEPLRRYTYLHMNMTDVRNRIAVDQQVTKGQVIGTLSNEFGIGSNGKPKADQTTPHLHFEIQTTQVGTDGNAHFTFVSPYMTLVNAYQSLLATGNSGDCPP